MSNFLHGKLTPSRPLPLSDLFPSSERLVLCVAANRMSRTCIEDAYEYACDRSTFGVRLIDQPIIRAKFSDMGRLVEANQAWIEQIAYHMSTTDKKQADLDLAGPVALLKVSCTRALEFCNREALQVLGGTFLLPSLTSEGDVLIIPGN
jgi:alkylation response protein AidB-like acyl-CoA dehydrogenase